jgi:UDP-glucose 6-dehydrogenase
MKVVVLGLWHLGCVTAACCAKFADVVGLDYDEQTIHHLRLPEVIQRSVGIPRIL